MRAFLAIDLPDEVKREIMRFGGILRRNDLLQAKFVEEENLHLTLKFFGEILEKETGMIADVLKEIHFPIFSCNLGKLGLFDDKILWIDLEDHGEIKKMHDLVDMKLGDFFEADIRFHNHVTLARIKRIKDKAGLAELFEKIQIQPVSFEVAEYTLKKSELTSSGPVYENVRSFRLG